MTAAPVYEAYDDYDDDEDYHYGSEAPATIDQDDQEGDEEEHADEDEYGPGVTITWSRSASTKKRESQRGSVSDVALEAYLDPLALVNCWEEALFELKAAHPGRFLPPRDAPRPLSQRQAKAPLWYGPSSTLPDPTPVASTSKLPDPASDAPSAATVIAAAYSTKLPETFEPGQPKKRKRLTGSQKKARKAAKLSSSSTNQPPRSDIGEEEEEEERSRSPMYAPASPNFNPNLDLASNPKELPPHLVPTAPIRVVDSVPTEPKRTNPPVSSHPAPPQKPQPPRLPSSFPSPPPITRLTGQEPRLEPETRENLLESALWSWYTAGYQTALYHAAMGVATFKPESEDE
ncbi:uncharacterized protein JCM15063_001615 [Sporobolomyces koalae]|uniref:uncharacterized protein n=1 Tax=Sporobolomyces koalae TaxID=500713 RepID=UPI00317B38B9